MSTPNTDREDAPADRPAETGGRNSTAQEGAPAPSAGPPSPPPETANRKNADAQGARDSSGPLPDILPEIVSPSLSPSGKQKSSSGNADGWPAIDLPVVDAVFESVPPRKTSRPPSADATEAVNRWSVLLPARAPGEANSASASAPPAARPARSFGLRAIIMTAAAAVIGALAGSLTTAGWGYMVGTPSAGPSYDQVFADGLARIDHQVTVLKGTVEGSGRTQSGQIAKIVERLDRAEKARNDAGTRLAKASDVLDRVEGAVDSSARTQSGQIAKIVERLDRSEKAQNDAGTRLAKASDVLDRVERRLASSSEVTGALGEAHASAPAAATPLPPPAGTAAVAAGPSSSAPAKPKQPPVVEGWVLRDVYDGEALIQGRGGLVAVMPGDNLPGLGRVEAVKRQDGRWVVVTARGLIMPR